MSSFRLENNILEVEEKEDLKSDDKDDDYDSQESEAPVDVLIHPMTKRVTFAKCTYQKFKAIVTKW
jgi:hypothetical protein